MADKLYSAISDSVKRLVDMGDGTWAERVVAVTSPASSSLASAMATSQVTVPATANGILILAANANRKGGFISNPNPLPVYIDDAATGLTVLNGAAIPAGGGFNLEGYIGAVYGIVATGTQVVTVAEFS